MNGNRHLGEFLRSRRERLDPASLGLPLTRRRRTPGLRREEVAERAGISSEWYVKLEQGRDVSPSAETVAALARALSLNAADTAHLRRLAEGRSESFVRELVPDIVAAIVDGLSDPAYITGARGDVLAWNAAADEMFGFSRLPDCDRNIYVFVLTSDAARLLFADDWTPQAKRMVALFRVAYDCYAGDPAFEELVARLARQSPAFATWWSAHDIDMPKSGEKTLHRAGVGGQHYVHASFQCNDNSALKLAMYKRVDPGT